MNSYICRNWIPITSIFVCIDYYLWQNFDMLVKDFDIHKEKTDTTLWLNFF